MFKFLKKIFKLHDWQDVRFGVRKCKQCGRYDYLGENRYPAIGEPKYRWLFANTKCEKEDLLKLLPRSKNEIS